MGYMGSTGSNPHGEASDLVMVPVPRSLLSVVYEFLAIEMKGLRVDSADTAATVISDDSISAPFEVACLYCHGPAFHVADTGYQCGRCGRAFGDKEVGIEVDRDNGTWTPAMIVSLRSELGTEGVPARVLDEIARKAPESVSTEQLARFTGIDPHRLRAELASLSKATRRLFGKKIWPMSAKQGWGSGDRMGYRMSPEVASWWLKSQPPC